MTLSIAGLPMRPIGPADHDALIGLVASAYAEYPGCVLDLPGVDADLPRFSDHLRELGGAGWVVTDGDRVVASVALAPTTFEGQPAAELKRLYVAASHRRRGLAAGLLDHVEERARSDHDSAVLVAWSDTRFTDAHRLYESRGYLRQPATRDLHDPSNTTEYQYLLSLLP